MLNLILEGKVPAVTEDMAFFCRGPILGISIVMNRQPEVASRRGCAPPFSGKTELFQGRQIRADDLVVSPPVPLQVLQEGIREIVLIARFDPGGHKKLVSG